MKDISLEQSSSVPIQLSNNIHLQEELKDPPNNNNLKKSTRMKPLRRTYLVKNKVETYSLDELGTIENAEKHRNANRPLHVINEINYNVNFCHCCDLPCEEKGIIEPFNMCDDTDTFAECGVGISLYFFFFKFIILISFLGLSLSIILMVLNRDYSGDIKDVCNTKYKNVNNSLIGNCYGYVTENNNDENYYTMFNQWLQRFSSDCIFIYRKIPQQLMGKSNNNVDDVLVNYSLVNFIFLITTFVLNIIFLFLIRAQIKRLKLDNITIRDYSVLISNSKRILTDYLDSKNKNKFIIRESQIVVENYKEFKAYVNDYIINDKNLNDIKIEQVNICYNLGEYLVLMGKFERRKRSIFQINNNPHTIKRNKEKNLEGNKRKYYKYPFSYIGLYCCSLDGKTLEQLNQEKNDLDKQLKSEEDRVRGTIKEKDFTDYMLISFNKIEDKEKFLSHYPNNFFDKITFFFANIKYYICCCCIDKIERDKFWRSRNINARDPTEPEDIYWQNFRYTSFQRLQYTASTYVICLLIIIVSFGIVFGLSLLQEHLYNDNKENGDTNIFLKYLTSLSITAVISIINTIIQYVLEKLTEWEKPISKSNYVLSLSIKISLFTFLNSAVIPLISKYIVAINEKEGKDKYIDYYVKRKRDDLLIDDLFVYFIVNAIITPLLWILNFPYWYKKIRICCITRKKEPNKHHHMTQKELNELYEYPDMYLAYKLSYLVKTLSMCLFFMPIFPFGNILAFVGFIFAYWVEKYVFTHQCKRPDMLDEIIEKYYANFFIVVLFIGGIGDYIFLYDAFDTNVWTFVNIILFGVLIIMPYSKFINCNYVDANVPGFRDRPLSDVYFTFYNDYQRLNPLTKKLGLENYLTELKKKGYLSDNAFNLALENIDKLNLMEMYYGIAQDNMPLIQQSIIANIPSESVNNINNLRGTFLAAGGLRSTIIRPELQDNVEAKNIKRNFFETQIYNLFGKAMVNKGMRLNEVKEEDENKTEKYNKELEDNVRLEEIPISETIVKDKNIDLENIPVSETFVKDNNLENNDNK